MNSRILSLAGAMLCAAAGALPAQQYSHAYDHVLNDQGASRLTFAP